MKYGWYLLLFISNTLIAQTDKHMEKMYTYLALGDSYTIGEAIPLQKSFPYQTVYYLREEGYFFAAPEIIAKTGWTTDELLAAMRVYRFLPQYDFVTLLIGVNNQYRCRPVADYAKEFELLLVRAIAFASGKPDHVMVISIPDWGATPFAAGRDRQKIADEIEEFNKINKAMVTQYKAHYIDITAGTKEALDDSSLVAADGLHPSEKEYSRWAEQVVSVIKTVDKH